MKAWIDYYGDDMLHMEVEISSWWLSPREIEKRLKEMMRWLKRVFAVSGDIATEEPPGWRPMRGR